MKQDNVRMSGDQLLASCMALALILLAGLAQPIAAQEKWWPSEWGAEDQRGSANRVTPERILAALRLAKEGKVYPIGQVYENGMPALAGRNYKLMIPHSNPPVGKNQVAGMVEYVCAELGQVGTQFDGLGHVGVGDIFYNGNDRREFAHRSGLKKLGVENAGAFITRGVLIDVAAYKGVERLEMGYEVSAADLQGALAKQKIALREGDSIFLRTGWSQLWMKDNTTYMKGEPGWGPDACDWIVKQKPAMTGCDTWGCDVIPNPKDPDIYVACHHILGTKAGIYNLENMNLEELSKDGVYEFLFMFTPLPLKGATGSPGAPIAIK